MSMRPGAGDTAPVVAIVDPLSTGVCLAPEFLRHGWRCAAVLSGTVDPAYAAQLRRDDFTEVLLSPGNSAEDTRFLAGRLAALHPRHVVPGCEWGVNLAEDLARVLGLPGNEYVADRPRRAKDAMMRRAAASGLRVPAGASVTSARQLLRWLSSAGRWPVVLKPIASAGSDGVLFCADAAQAVAGFERLKATTNALGLRNDAVLVQERLIGQQYFVNSVSLGGQHHIHEIWRDDRVLVDGKPVYDRQVLLDPEGDLQDLLAEFAAKTLTALGVREGPAHTELIADGHGLALIECGARLEGGVTPGGPTEATGHSQVSLTVQRYTDPSRFRDRIGSRYVRIRALAVVCLVAPADGTVGEQAGAMLASVPSVLCGSALTLRPGSPVRRTVDLFTSPGHVYLVADDPGDLDRDYRLIRDLEADGFYRAGKAGDSQRRIGAGHGRLRL